MLPSSSTPWKPATTATQPFSRSWRRLHFVDRDDARPREGRVGQHLHLPAGVAARLHAQGEQRHRQQPDRDLLAGGGDHVELARVRVLLQAGGERQQPVGLARHGRGHHHDAVPGRLPLGDAPGHVADALDRADRGAAEFLDDEGHVAESVTSPHRPSGTADTAAYRDLLDPSAEDLHAVAGLARRAQRCSETSAPSRPACAPRLHRFSPAPAWKLPPSSAENDHDALAGATAGLRHPPSCRAKRWSGARAHPR